MARGKKAIPQATRRAVALRYGCEPGGTATNVPCHWCGAPGDIVWDRLRDGRPGSWVWFSHELDHLQPEVLGGTGDPENIVLACRSCNRRRRCGDIANARHPHAILTEEGLPNSLDPHPRKGREGKGREGKGIRFSPQLTWTRARTRSSPSR